MVAVRTCPHPERAARALLSHLARPTDRLLPALLAVMEPGEVLAAIRAGRVPAAAAVGTDVLALGLGSRLRSSDKGGVLTADRWRRTTRGRTG
jgi:hypothetical protein